MKRAIILLTLLILNTIGWAYVLMGSETTGFAQDPVTPTPLPINDADALAEALTADGYTVELSEETTDETLFSIAPILLNVNDELVYVYVYGDAELALVDRALIQMNGYMIGEAMVDWISFPHFYWHENLLVLYVGETLEITAGLSQHLGREIAGIYAEAPLTDMPALVEFFAASQLDITDQEETLVQDFFSVDGQLMSIQAEDVQFFIYDDVETAEAEASQIAPDGASTPTMMITWVADPHFYRHENVIALYLGENLAILHTLTSLFGPQFAGVESEPAPSTISDLDSLAEALSATGVEVVATDETVIQDFFFVDGQVLTINGETVQVFVYEDEATATSETSQIGPDGSPMTMMISWLSTPHFYQSENIVVLYVGTDAEVLAVLESVFGPQFAGGE